MDSGGAASSVASVCEEKERIPPRSIAQRQTLCSSHPSRSKAAAPPRPLPPPSCPTPGSVRRDVEDVLGRGGGRHGGGAGAGAGTGVGAEEGTDQTDEESSLSLSLPPEGVGSIEGVRGVGAISGTDSGTSSSSYYCRCSDRGSPETGLRFGGSARRRALPWEGPRCRTRSSLPDTDRPLVRSPPSPIPAAMAVAAASSEVPIVARTRVSVGEVGCSSPACRSWIHPICSHGAALDLISPGFPFLLCQVAVGAVATSSGDRVAADCGVCAICLDRIALQETALVKGCASDRVTRLLRVSGRDREVGRAGDGGSLH
jgi:hypothetical protein